MTEKVYVIERNSHNEELPTWQYIRIRATQQSFSIVLLDELFNDGAIISIDIDPEGRPTLAVFDNEPGWLVDDAEPRFTEVLTLQKTEARPAPGAPA